MAINPLEMLYKMERRIEFSDEDKSILQSNADWAKIIAPEMANHFYSYLGKDEEMNAILNETEGRIHRLRETFIEWFHEMFTGIDNWDEKYADRRWKIGLVHVRIGITPQHVVPAIENNYKPNTLEVIKSPIIETKPTNNTQEKVTNKTELSENKTSDKKPVVSSSIGNVKPSFVSLNSISDRTQSFKDLQKNNLVSVKSSLSKKSETEDLDDSQPTKPISNNFLKNLVSFLNKH